MQEVKRGGAGLLLFSGFLPLHGGGGGSGVKRRDLRENVSDILWLTDGKPLRRASYTDMRPFGDLCKHFNICPEMSAGENVTRGSGFSKATSQCFPSI